MNLKIETEMLKSLIKAICLNGLIDTSTLVFKKNYLETVNMDISNICFSGCHFPRETFLEYEVAEEEDIGIEAGEVMKMITQLSGDEISINRDKDSLVLVTNRHEQLKIPMIKTTKQKNPSLIQVGKNGELNISTDLTFYMDETIHVLKKKELESMREDETTFEVINGSLSVMQETTDGYSFRNPIKEEVKSDDFDIMFNTEYLKDVFASVIDDEVQIRLGDKLPIILENKTASYQTIFLLMARIKTD